MFLIPRNGNRIITIQEKYIVSELKHTIIKGRYEVGCFEHWFFEIENVFLKWGQPNQRWVNEIVIISMLISINKNPRE